MGFDLCDSSARCPVQSIFTQGRELKGTEQQTDWDHRRRDRRDHSQIGDFEMKPRSIAINWWSTEVFYMRLMATGMEAASSSSSPSTDHFPITDHVRSLGTGDERTTIWTGSTLLWRCSLLPEWIHRQSSSSKAACPFGQSDSCWAYLHLLSNCFTFLRN